MSSLITRISSNGKQTKSIVATYLHTTIHLISKLEIFTECPAGQIVQYKLNNKKELDFQGLQVQKKRGYTRYAIWTDAYLVDKNGRRKFLSPWNYIVGWEDDSSKDRVYAFDISWIAVRYPRYPYERIQRHPRRI